MPYTIKPVPSVHDPNTVKYHVVSLEQPVAVHDTHEEAEAHVAELTSGKTKKRKAAKPARKHK